MKVAALLSLARIGIAFVLCAASASLAAPKERWVYAPANYQVNEQADRIIALMKRAKAAGYTHLLITDSKFPPRADASGALLRERRAREGRGEGDRHRAGPGALRRRLLE
jgi:hypothetical protein